ncbi:MAG: hypothetical protein JSS63_12890 [Bacteroidetes bacterium]|nr:hypothetical protein [Bacteroidota bacterium]
MLSKLSIEIFYLPMIQSVKYRLELINRDASLDLRTKSKEIENAVRITKSEKIGGVGSCRIVQPIEQYAITLQVTETKTFWHTRFCSHLANEPSMRVYCKEGDSSKMFKSWKKI